MDNLRQLEGITSADLTFVGAKASALGDLLRAGFNVPRGFVLTTKAYLEFIASLRDPITSLLTTEVILDPSALEAAATEIRGWVTKLHWKSGLEQDIGSALADFPSEESFAARTSVPSDDLATAFGSGVERAYLGLVGLSELETAAARSWATLWNSRAMYYRYRKKMPQTQVATAVLIQSMVRARAAGVMFTENPMTVNPDEIQIDSIWGLGAPLTSARAKPDRFYFSKRSNSISSVDVQEKMVQLVVGANGLTEQQVVRENLVTVPSLSNGEVEELAQIGKQIEAFFGIPQDIEWAIDGNGIFILQARPIALRNA